MKNILINYLGMDGSGPVFSLEMAAGLAQNGYNVYAVISKRIDNLSDWLESKFFQKVITIDTHTSKKEYALHYFRFTKTAALKASIEFQGIEFDCVLRTFPHPMLDAVEKGLKIKKNVTICHDPIPHSGEGMFARIRNKMVMASADEVIVLTRKFIPLISEYYGKDSGHVYYMPHGKMSSYKKKQQKEPVIVYDNSFINFVFFGRIEEYKGLKILGEAYKKLVERHKNISMTIAGSGSFVEYVGLYKRLPNVNIINRYIKDEEVGTLFDSESVIAVVPYINATQSGVIPIALEYGNPIIASKTGGLLEQLDDGNVGIFANAGDTDDLCAKMEMVITDKSMRIIERRKSRDYSQMLEWQNVTKVFEQILR